jgi:hypothetical protein
MWKSKNSIRSKSEISLQLWKTWLLTVDINKALESTGEYIKTSAMDSLGCYELKQHKLWFDEVCSELLEERNQNCIGCRIQAE